MPTRQRMPARSSHFEVRQRRRSAFIELTVMGTKDLLRNVQTGFAMLFLFGFYLVVIFAIDFAFTSGNAQAVVSVAASSPSFQSDLLGALASRGINTTSTAEDANMSVSEDSGRVVVTISADELPSWKGVWQAVRATGVATSDISVVDTTGDRKIDILQANLGPALGLGFMGIAFIGTTVPLVSMRERGTLRLLGTTPLRTSSFILSLLPARYALGLIEVGVVLGIALSRNYVDGGTVWRLLITMLISLFMLFPLAFLFGSRASNAATMQQTMAMLAMILVIPAGGIFPPEIIPDVVQVALNALPTSWMIYALGTDLTGAHPFTSVYILWALMLVVSAAALITASKVFSWDQGDQ